MVSTRARPIWQISGVLLVSILFCYPLVRFRTELGLDRAPWSEQDNTLSSARRAQHVQSLRKLVSDYLPSRFAITDWQNQRNLTLDTATGLADCLESNTCGKEELKVILLSSYHFGSALDGNVAGEEIWARSTIEAFESLGYTLLITYETLEAVLVYQAIPDLVKMVIWEPHNLRECLAHGRKAQGIIEWKDDPSVPDVPDTLVGEMEQAADPEGKGCFKAEAYPSGIPVWKLFTFNFWSWIDHPLGASWTLSPENYRLHGYREEANRNTYLGYSIETWCKQNPTYPFTRRENRAFIYAKEVHYFLEGTNLFFVKGRQLWKELKASLGLDFLAAVGGAEVQVPEEGVDNIGRQSQPDFYDVLAKSRAMIGLGQPYLSPSPFDALCLGVPFINPIHEWNKDFPDDRNHWNCQHNGLLWENAPLVYHVHAHNTTELELALEQAATNPIDRYIPVDRTTEAVRERHRSIVATDWKEKAEELMAKRRAEGGKLYVL